MTKTSDNPQQEVCPIFVINFVINLWYFVITYPDGSTFMPNPLLSVRIPPELVNAIEQRATFMGWTKSQVVIDLLANGLALEERRDDGIKHQSLNLGRKEADKTNHKNSVELNSLWSELEALKQQMAQLHAKQLQCEATRERLAAIEASLLGSATRSN